MSDVDQHNKEVRSAVAEGVKLIQKRLESGPATNESVLTLAKSLAILESVHASSYVEDPDKRAAAALRASLATYD